MRCCLPSLLTTTASLNTMLSATVSPNNLDKTLTFKPFCQMFGPAVAAVVPLILGGCWTGAAATGKAIMCPSGIIDHRSSPERSLEGDEPLYASLPTKFKHQSMATLNVCACREVPLFGFI